MKPKDILIATLLILTLSSLLSGCKTDGGNLITEKKTAIEEYLRKASEVKKDVKMVLESSKKEEEEVRISIYLENPEKKPLTSVQSWFSFNPSKLKGKEILTSDSLFTLPAPYSNAFDNIDGLVMIGRSNPEPVTQGRVKVAEMVFEVVKQGVTMMDVYDYREDLNGHTTVNTMLDGRPVNILKKPEMPILVLEN